MDVKRTLKLSCFCAFLNLIVSIPIITAGYWLFAFQVSTNKPVESLHYAAIAIIAAPLIETCIFLLVDIVLKEKSKVIKLFVSCFLFSVLHYSDGIAKIVFTIVPAFIYGYAFFYFGRTRKEGYWISALGHMLNNLFGILFVHTSVFMNV
jgi:membrane protease YdiL (CAAX protease family)